MASPRRYGDLEKTEYIPMVEYGQGSKESDYAIPPYTSRTISSSSFTPIVPLKSSGPYEEVVDRTQPSPNDPKSMNGFEKFISWILVPEVFAVGIFLTAIYSTTLSIAWFLVAVIRPHWGTVISNTAGLSPSVASIIIAAMAKTIEMSFTTVMIVCIGQHLTNKARGSGITANDLQLKSMILLPCALITQKGGFRALWKTGLLGVICIMAYLAATLYTTASDAMVSPRLSITPSTATNLSAYLQTSIANTYHIGASCPNPPNSVQNVNTCITTQQAGVSFRNYVQYLTNWKTATNGGQQITQQNRPPPSALFSDNIAVTGQWLNNIDYPALSKQYGRLITGTTMAMPYAGVVNATTIPENKLNVINQGTGQLSVNAKAATPVVGVTCAVVTAKELIPIVYSNWTHPVNTTLTAGAFDGTYKTAAWRSNATVFDDVFGFNNSTRHRPVFYSMPEQYNTEFDGEGTYRDMIYILMNSNVSSSATVDKEQYTLCGLNFTLIGGCSSIYTANNTGTALQLNCDPSNEMAMPTSKVAIVTAPQDWVNVAAVWGRSISLGAGLYNSDAAIAAILTQLVTTNSTFDPRQPSMPDSLAILSAGTLLQSTIDTPFDGFWPFDAATGGPQNLLPTAVIQKFEAKVQVSDYSSGMTNDWKNAFVAELLIVVLMNIGCLVYLVYLTVGRVSWGRKHGLKRIPAQRIKEDITELREVFTTAISSPAVCIIDTPDAGRTVQWRYHNGIFRPSNYGNRAKVNVQYFQHPGNKQKVNVWI